MENKKLLDTYQKRIVVNMDEYEYVEFLANLKSENINSPSKIVKFFVQCYLANDPDVRKIVEEYKSRNKIAGRAKKQHILKQEELAKKSEKLYNLDDEDIEGIYDLLDEQFPG